MIHACSTTFKHNDFEVLVTQSHFEVSGWLESFVTRIDVAGFEAHALSRD